MSSGSYRQVHVQCPFYLYDDGKRRITCEGITDECTTALSFRKKKGYEIQMDTFCCSSYKNCEVFRMLSEKYKEE